MSLDIEQRANREADGIPGLTEEERHKAAISVQVRRPPIYQSLVHLLILPRGPIVAIARAGHLKVTH